jgi:hypothetical protein
MVGEEKEIKGKPKPIVAAQIWISETGLGDGLRAVKQNGLPIGAQEGYLIRRRL